VVHVTTCYQITDRENPHTDMGLWHHKIPVEAVDQSQPELWAIDSRIAPVEGEHILIKKQASAFHGTYLASYLHAAGIDTILVTGVTATACVRQTICDGLADGFRHSRRGRLEPVRHRREVRRRGVRRSMRPLPEHGAHAQRLNSSAMTVEKLSAALVHIRT
jgi:hypothetical protein